MEHDFVLFCLLSSPSTTGRCHFPGSSRLSPAATRSPCMPEKVEQRGAKLICVEEELTRGLSGVSREMLRSWQSLTTSLPQAAVTANPL